VQDLLAAAAAEARQRWQLAAIPDEVFADAVAARVEGETDPDAALARLALADLYLAIACLRGDRAAMGAFERLVRDSAASVVGRLGVSAPAVEDVVQELLVKLLVGPEPKLGAFAGHGALHAWLRVAAMRTAISFARRDRRDLADDDMLAEIADDTDDQALAFLKESYRAEFKRAFAAALAELPARSRTLLRLQIIDQLSYEDIAAYYEVSRATAARWLAEARTTLVAGTQRRLGEALQLEGRELGELTRLIASTLYSTLPRLLRQAG
jgi:RNA polymerase sigma-70 factor (ECF subfamily)